MTSDQVLDVFFESRMGIAFSASVMPVAIPQNTPKWRRGRNVDFRGGHFPLTKDSYNQTEPFECMRPQKKTEPIAGEVFEFRKRNSTSESLSPVDEQLENPKKPHIERERGRNRGGEQIACCTKTEELFRSNINR